MDTPVVATYVAITQITLLVFKQLLIELAADKVSQTSSSICVPTCDSQHPGLARIVLSIIPDGEGARARSKRLCGGGT